MRHTTKVLFPWFFVACMPQEPDGATSTSTGPTSTTAGATADATEVTGTTEVADGSSGPPPEPLPEPIDVMDFSRCDGTERDPLCIATDETCICGLECLEYGPAGYSGRCPFGDFAALCPGKSEVPYVCIIPCTLDSDCPDPDMVCRPCPEEFETACQDLGSFYEDAELNAGSSMCTWPKA